MPGGLTWRASTWESQRCLQGWGRAAKGEKVAAWRAIAAGEGRLPEEGPGSQSRFSALSGGAKWGADVEDIRGEMCEESRRGWEGVGEDSGPDPILGACPWEAGLTGQAGWGSEPRGSGRASAPLRPSAAPSRAGRSHGQGAGCVQEAAKGRGPAGSQLAVLARPHPGHPRRPPQGSSPGIWEWPQDLPAALLGEIGRAHV